LSGYLFDTAVISEGQKPKPNAALARWLASALVSQTYITTVNLGEIRYGIALLPKGRRREELDRWLSQELIPRFRDRIIAFDSLAALAWSDILANAARRGTKMPRVDAQIAAMAKVHSLTLVTRNSRHFVDCGIDVIDPWG
jgi:toxin FitB